MKPSIILADEPTGNLDSKTSQEVLSLLKKQVNSLAEKKQIFIELEDCPHIHLKNKGLGHWYSERGDKLNIQTFFSGQQCSKQSGGGYWSLPD